MAVPRMREGDWVCRTHDIVTPDRSGCVPACPHCGAMVLHAVRERGRDYLMYAEPSPTHCAGPGRHLLGPGRINTGWHACGCSPAARAGNKGHRSWRCGECGDEQLWPPHEPGHDEAAPATS